MIRIRKGEIGDEQEIARVHFTSSLTSYTGIIPDSFFTTYSQEYLVGRWGEFLRNTQDTLNTVVFVCEVIENTSDSKARIVGLLSGGVEREKLGESDAEVYKIYLLQEFQKQNLGKNLISHFSKWVVQNGYRNFRLWVLAINPACGFYEKIGGIRQDFSKISEFEGVQFQTLSYQWVHPFPTLLNPNGFPLN